MSPSNEWNGSFINTLRITIWKVLKLKSLSTLLNKVDPDMEVVVVAPDSGYYTDEYHTYLIDKSEIDVSDVTFAICVG